MRLAMVLALCGFLLGCTTYYKIHDPSTGSTYYSTEIDKERGGAVTLKDARTNAEVTIQNSEVMEITADQYDAAIRTVEVTPSGEPVSNAPTEAESTGSNPSN